MVGTRRRPQAPTTVLLVDEDAIFRHGMRELLQRDGFEVAGEASSAEEAMEQAVAASPDVVLVAVWMRGASGIETARRLCEAVPESRVVMLTNSADPADAEEAIRVGACGYVLKDHSSEEIVAAVGAAAAGWSPISPQIAAGLLEDLSTRLDRDGSGLQLTSREQRVLELVAAGHRNTEIAENLSISVYTVKRHVSNLLSKLEVENRTQAAVEAARRGLV